MTNKAKIDFDKIRNKVAQLSGERRKPGGSGNFWRPDVGEYTVRIVPFRNNDGQPFKERWFYYGIGDNPGLLTLRQFGKPDPVQDLIDKLRASDTPEGYEQAKKLYPKMRAYAAVIVRGEEDKGPRLWSFGKMVYQNLLNIMLDADYGDITDELDGHDIKVTVSQPAGRMWKQTDVMPRPRPSALSDDPALIEEWISNVPDLDAIYTTKSYDELEKIVNDWISGNDSSSNSTGTEKFGSKTESVKEEKSSSQPMRDIDDVFKELETE